MVRRMLLGAIAIVLLSAAPAVAQYGFTVSPGSVTPGGQVTVSGEGCEPGAEVTITMTQTAEASQRAVGDSVVVATVIADEEGKFSVTFDVPPGTAFGTYLVEAFCGGVKVGEATIEIVPPGSPSGPGTTGSGTIVRTGSDLNGLGLLGAGLLTAGGVILIATKGRRHRASAA